LKAIRAPRGKFEDVNFKGAFGWSVRFIQPNQCTPAATHRALPRSEVRFIKPLLVLSLRSDASTTSETVSVTPTASCPLPAHVQVTTSVEARRLFIYCSPATKEVNHRI